MSGPNHIVGGTVFTGLYLSMWDINIYNHPLFLFFTAFFAVLPDIDHTKSLVGKCFYPIAKWFDKKFGHRTITHSLLFYLTLGIIIGIIEKTWINSTTITKIYYWSYGSHLILDMLTLQGIPLFYPFKKNPCVLPANPKMRFRSADIKAESVVFVVFLTTAFLSKDLFANGFWNTYNTNFGTIKHLNNERILSENAIKVQFDILQDNERISGQGILINSNPEEATIFSSPNGFITLKSADKIYTLKPIRTTLHIKKNEVHFTDISSDSLQQLCKTKAIIQLKVQSNTPIDFTLNHKPQRATNLELNNIYNPIFVSKTTDSTDVTVEKELQLIALEIASNAQIQQQYIIEKSKLQEVLQTIEIQKNSQILAEKEKAITNYQKAMNNYESLQKPSDRSQELRLKQKYLSNKLHINTQQSITGYINFLTFK